MSKKRCSGEGNVTQLKDGRWQARLSLGSTPDGKRNRKAFYGKTRKEAVAKMNEWRSNNNAVNWINPQNMTVEQLANDWLETRHRDKSPTTKVRREQILRLHINPHLGPMNVQKVAPMHVHRMLECLTPKGKHTQHYAHAVFHALFTYAVRMKLVSVNPVSSIERPKPEKKEMQIFSDDEIKRIFVAAREKRLSALFALAACTGMRQGELLALKWLAVDFETGILHVRETLAQVYGKFIVKAPKSKAGLRSINLPSMAVEALHEHRKAMLKEGRDVRDGMVFCSRKGTYIRRSNLIRDSWNKILKSAGLPLRPFHSLRHSHASSLLRNGQSIKAIAKRLGHSDAAMTLRVYAHVLPDEDSQLAMCIQSIYA